MELNLSKHLQKFCPSGIYILPQFDDIKSNLHNLNILCVNFRVGWGNFCKRWSLQRWNIQI
jgi:hypothetical protein